MSESNGQEEGLLLSGIDGSNPLGFLAALGTFVTTATICPNVRMKWSVQGGNWKPVLIGVTTVRSEFVEQLTTALLRLPMDAFAISKRMPFPADELRKQACEVSSSARERRFVDFLAAFGSDAVRDGDTFVDTAFRMVRSGDAAGQGFPHYAIAIRKATDAQAIDRTLFETWTYQDSGYSLRWAPIEDSNYALRWKDPSKDAKNNMLGANSLALESLQLLATAPLGKRLGTTGFSRQRRADYFSWPIWDVWLNEDVLRSLLTLPGIHANDVAHEELRERGIVQVFRSRRFSPNVYYRNFAPATST